MKRLATLLILLVSVVVAAYAQEARPVGDDPEIEKRLNRLSQEIRCLVCQNETLAESRADLAVDLRNQIREMMKAGKTDQEIVQFLTERYGDFVLFRPPVKPSTYLLWFGPFVVLLGGLFLLQRYVKQRRELIGDRTLSQADHRRAEEILKEQPEKGAL